MPEPTTTKLCRLCGRRLPLTQFSAHPKTRDRKVLYCHECRAAAFALRKADPRFREHVLALRRANKAKHRQLAREKREMLSDIIEVAAELLRRGTPIEELDKIADAARERAQKR